MTLADLLMNEQLRRVDRVVRQLSLGADRRVAGEATANESAQRSQSTATWSASQRCRTLASAKRPSRSVSTPRVAHSIESQVTTQPLCFLATLQSLRRISSGNQAGEHRVVWPAAMGTAAMGRLGALQPESIPTPDTRLSREGAPTLLHVPDIIRGHVLRDPTPMARGLPAA